MMLKNYIYAATERWRWALVVIIIAVAWMWNPVTLFKSHGNFEVGGSVHPDFTEVLDVFREGLSSGRERGCSFAVYHQGKPLVDLWGGLANPTTGALWHKDTISQGWSCTKGMAAVALALLVDRSFLDYAAPVCKYWPEFAENGKENITVGMLLSHKAGLVGLGRRISLLEYRDNWTQVEQMLATRTPAWKPGTHYMYHAFTFGMYADALLRKVDPLHRNLSMFFKEEIAEPLGLDYHIGLPADQLYRSTKAEYVSMFRLFLSTVVLRPERWKWLPEIFFRSRLHDSVSVLDIYDNMAAMEDPELRSIGLASMVGFGNARGLAKFYDYLANNGSINGKRLLSEQQVNMLFTPFTTGTPVIVAPDLDFTVGLIEATIHGHRIFGHNGYGGQSGFADPDDAVGVGYITNFNSDYSDRFDPRILQLMQAVRNSFKKYKKIKE